MATQYRKCCKMKWIKGHLYNCGHCSACLARRNSEIACRVLLDMRHSAKTSCCHIMKFGARFVHLTYNDDSLPENGSLVKEHFVQYIKRVREHIYRKTGCKIMFVGSGEYGAKHGRPHYHIFFWRLPEFQGLFDILVSCWKKHHKNSRVVVDRLRGRPAQAVNYCVGYAGKSCSKYDKNSFESNAQYRVRTGRDAPFVQWSYGVGLDWFNAHKDRLENDMKIIVDGQHLAFPRYFRKKMFESMSFDKWKGVFDKQVEDFRRVGMKNLEFDDLFKAYVYADSMARGFVRKEYNKKRASVRQFYAESLEEFGRGDISHGVMYDKWKRITNLYDIASSVGLADVFECREFCLNEAMQEWKASTAREYYAMYCVKVRNILDKLACPNWNSDIDECFSDIADRYRILQQEYLRCCRVSIEQAGKNYKMCRELKDFNRYFDADYVELVDREKDLPVLEKICKNKRKR